MIYGCETWTRKKIQYRFNAKMHFRNNRKRSQNVRAISQKTQVTDIILRIRFKNNSDQHIQREKQTIRHTKSFKRPMKLQNSIWGHGPLYKKAGRHKMLQTNIGTRCTGIHHNQKLLERPEMMMTILTLINIPLARAMFIKKIDMYVFIRRPRIFIICIFPSLTLLHCILLFTIK